MSAARWNVRAPHAWRGVSCVAGLVLLAGCGWQRYAAAPPDESIVPRELAHARLDASADLAALAGLGAPHAGTQPWTPSQLGVLAAMRSRAVAAARSAVAASLARSRLARQRMNPQLQLGLERHSEREDWSDSRWSVGPGIEFTWVPPVVRRLTGERADLDVAIARLDTAERAWLARDAALDAALALLAWQEQAPHVAAAIAQREAAVAAARALVAAGIADPFEWQTMLLDRNDARLAGLSRTTAGAAARAALATALALPFEALSEVTLAAAPALPIPDLDVLRTRMLKAHPAVLRALTAHAQAERDLALAVAAQYPTVHLTPGYFFDQGDHVWSLLGGIVVPLFARHDVAIASAAATRDAAGAEVYAAQAAAIAELQRAHAAWRAAENVLDETRAIVVDIAAAHASLQRKRDAGIGDDLAVARAALQVEEARLQLALAQADARRSAAVLLASARVADLDPPFARLLDELTTAPADLNVAAP